jgi:hypothetical protein
MLKRAQYTVFAGSDYYPLGGVRDIQFRGNLTECFKYLANHSQDWWQIVDDHLNIYEQNGE